MNDLYPPGPQGVPAELTRPTAAYQQKAWLAVLSLGVFVLLYLALASWFCWTAYRVISDALASGTDGFLHYLVGGGAAFLAVFMLKALFFMKRGGTDGLTEITAADQPRLFAFLHRLADDAGAPRPARVYLSARVNAAVFYDLSVLNLLFPSRKNLEIGLALVNVLTVSEMKAVLAHEFGHFAQRSMAIGSWVYIAQQIASQVIAKRDALDKLLRMLSNFDVRVAWIGWILSLVVWSIRSLMDTLLRIVVLAQRALSRQMEFQADLVAVALTGSDEIVNALHKLQAADEAWSRTLSFTDAEVRQGRLPHDLFAIHHGVIDKTARILNDEHYGRVPPAKAVSGAAHRVFKTSFAQPPQMWSTHPASADREDNAKRVYLPCPHDARSAWLLFDDAQAVRQTVVQQLIGQAQVSPASEEDTLKALDERYSLVQYDARYRGAYLGRSIARHAVSAGELHQAALQQPDVLQALAALYPVRLSDDLSLLRDLDEERLTLQALRDKVYQAAGGRLVHRGREISRRDLPAAITQVNAEADEVRQRIVAHDQQCRAAHLNAAEQLGQGWRPYLLGLIEVLHYAEHTAADVRDAQGVLGNVVAIVTADGKVSSRELKRLVEAANMLHEVLGRVYAQRQELQLDASLLARMSVASWAEMLEDFSLPQADKANISNWLNAIDSWVNGAVGPLSALGTAALEQLLVAEREVADMLGGGAPCVAAAAPSEVPRAYATLLPGQERKRQNKLGLWDRFQTADGVLPAVARVAVAGTIVGAVLGFGAYTGAASSLSIYNGLAQPVTVVIGQQQLTVAPFSAAHDDVALDDRTTIEARTASGEIIERFEGEVSGHARHYVYNVAGASPLVEWTAVYGNAAEESPRMLGALRWMNSSADVFFAQPPQSVSTKGGGARRTVLAGPGDQVPQDILQLLTTEEDKSRVVQAHARWDAGAGAHAAAWAALARR
ncbi:MAG: heat-shock protein HtpX [Rubrivivax sp.]|nr:MAG: heat-shock protein HtpX [Rubrivivax sp.]